MNATVPGELETPLPGGRLTTGVVRVGATVRRPASAASAFTARLLEHLARQGFDGCPRYLGRDEQGRDVLSFLPGQVPSRWRRFPDEQVRQAGRLLRRMHDATRDLAAAIGRGEVICHHDPGPHNTVFRRGRVVGFIDFDLAAPGDPIEDVAYLAWAWCLSSRPDRGPVVAQARQVRLLADGYGLGTRDRRRLPRAVHRRLRRNEEFWRTSGRERAGEMVAWTRRERTFLAAHRSVIAAGLARVRRD